MSCRTPVWIGLVLVGCTSDQSPMALIDVFDWREASASEDPFSGRPETVECPTSSRVIEYEEDTVYLEIDTFFCKYITLIQKTKADIFAGDTVVFRWGHRELNASVPAQGHVALLTNDSFIEDRVVDIPASEMNTVVEFEMPEDVPSGSPIWLHLHNHGDNQWLFYTPEVQPL